VAVSRVLVGSAAVCAFAGLIGGIPAASADPFPSCGPDQATAIGSATARDRHDTITQAPWNPVPVQSNYDACADLSAAVITIDMARPTSPRQVFLFHRGTYIGNATNNSRPFTTLDAAASTPNTVVLDFVSGRTCGTCDDGQTYPVRYYWNGVTVVMPDPIPPRQDWPIP
jgi:hypothetical protein